MVVSRYELISVNTVNIYIVMVVKGLLCKERECQCGQWYSLVISDISILCVIRSFGSNFGGLNR